MLIRKKNYVQTWFNAEVHQPDDARDVIGLVVKPVFIGKGKPPKLGSVPEVVCFEGGYWYDDPNPRARVTYWTEMVDLPEVLYKSDFKVW